MGRLTELIKKDFRLLVRSKTSSLIIFVGPLLLVLLLGLAYSQSSGFTFTASVYSSGYTAVSEEMISKLGGQGILVEKMDDIENCVGGVKRGESQVCIEFPAGLSERSAGAEVTFYVDYSQINLVWIILDAMNARVSESSAEISKGIAQNILDQLWTVDRDLTDAKESLASIRSSSLGVKDSAGEGKTGIQAINVSLDVDSLGIAESKMYTETALLNIIGINATFAELGNDTLNYVYAIRETLDSIANVSNISAEIADIRSDLSSIETKAENLISDSRVMTSNASWDANRTLESLNDLEANLLEAKADIDGVRKSKDSVLPMMDSIASKVDLMLVDIGFAEEKLTDSLKTVRELRGQDASSIASPITMKIEPISAQKTHFNSMYPMLLVLVMMITGILLASTLVIVEKKSKAFFRNHMTPTSFFTFSLSTYLTAIVVIAIQLLLFVSVSGFFFETEIAASMWVILVLVFLVSSVFVLIGMLIGFLFRTEETVTLASITLSSIFLMFSGAVIPLQSLPSYLKGFAMLNPFVISELGFRQALIFNFSFSKVLASIGMLALYVIILFALLLIFQDALKRLAFSHFNLHLTDAFSKAKKGSFRLFGPRDNAQIQAPVQQTAVPETKTDISMVQDTDKKV